MLPLHLQVYTVLLVPMCGVKAGSLELVLLDESKLCTCPSVWDRERIC